MGFYDVTDSSKWLFYYILLWCGYIWWMGGVNGWRKIYAVWWLSDFYNNRSGSQIMVWTLTLLFSITLKYYFSRVFLLCFFLLNVYKPILLCLCLCVHGYVLSFCYRIWMVVIYSLCNDDDFVFKLTGKNLFSLNILEFSYSLWFYFAL